ncbi:MAG: M28 family peptidase [Candidatus Melainabacteria bacterium]|nr:M28 family peptidase [Candidatus Melainabacteria bacterium]
MFGYLITAALIGVVVFLVVRHFRAKDEVTGQPIIPLETDFHPIHRGKIHVHSHGEDGPCKFSREEVRRTMHQKVDPIDISNLPAREPFVEKLLACIRADELTDLVAGLSGEKAVYVGDKSVILKSRSSHGEGVYLAMTWLEQFYRSLSITATRIPYTIRGKTYFNLEAKVAGKMTGAKKRVYIYGSHLDSTAGNTWSNEKVAPGADDDGSGTIAVLKIAEAFNSLVIPDDVEIRFLHFTGEEQGLWGSIKYSDACAAAKDNIVGMIQCDMIGYCRTTEHMFDVHDNIDQNGSHVLTIAIVRAIAQYGLNLKPIDTHNNAIEGRSDHAGFLNHGYKAVLVSERFTDEDFTPYYHQVTDTVDKFRMPFYVDIIRALIAAGVNLTGITGKK